MRMSYRLQTASMLVAPVLAALLAAVAATRGGTAQLAVSGLAALAVVAAVFSLRPEHVFLFWLFTAPFVQDVGSGRLQHLIRIAVYSAPPLFFLAWATLQRRSVRGSFVDVLPAGYVAFVSLSALVAGVEVSPTQVFAIVATGVIVYYFSAFGAAGDDLVERAVGIMLNAGLIVAGLVILGKATGIGLGYSPDPIAGVTRATGPLGSPSYLGMLLGMNFVLALSVLVWNGPASLRGLSLASMLVSPPALFLTLTRGPMIAAGALGLLVLLSRARVRWPSVLAGLIAILVVASLWSSITSRSLYRDRFSNQTNVQARLLIDRWSLELAGQKPILGWGYGSFDRVKNSANLDSGSLSPSVGLYYTSHNTFLTILVELGSVGLLLLIGPWIVTALSSVRHLRRDPAGVWAVVACLGALGVWVINAGTIDYRFFPFAWVLPWLAVGLLRRLALDTARRETQARMA